MSRPSRAEADLNGSSDAAASPIAVATTLLGRINEWIIKAASVAILLAALVLTLGVLLRYILKVSTDWQDETAVFLIVGSIFMCGAYVQSYRGHVGIEAVAAILPAGINRVRRLLVDIVSFSFCAFFSWKSWTLLHEAVRDGQTTGSSFAPPLWIPYGLMSTGMSLLTVQILLQIWAHFAQPKEQT
jgi:TRAP-type C4-dicarboxylate transport system permease small subunit